MKQEGVGQEDGGQHLLQLLTDRHLRSFIARTNHNRSDVDLLEKVKRNLINCNPFNLDILYKILGITLFEFSIVINNLLFLSQATAQLISQNSLP